MYTNLQEVTADELNSWLPVSVQKLSDTGRASTVLAADPDLVLPLKANYVYEGAFHVFSSGGNAAGDWSGVLKWTSGTLSGSGHGPANTLAAGTDADVTAGPTTRLDTDGTGVVINAGTSATGIYIQMPFYISMGGSDGTVTLWWAQFTSNATATNVLTGSWASARRVA